LVNYKLYKNYISRLLPTIFTLHPFKNLIQTESGLSNGSLNYVRSDWTAADNVISAARVSPGRHFGAESVVLAGRFWRRVEFYLTSGTNLC